MKHALQWRRQGLPLLNKSEEVALKIPRADNCIQKYFTKNDQHTTQTVILDQVEVQFVKT